MNIIHLTNLNRHYLHAAYRYRQEITANGTENTDDTTIQDFYNMYDGCAFE